jgi:hypothetical protein
MTSPISPTCYECGGIIEPGTGSTWQHIRSALNTHQIIPSHSLEQHLAAKQELADNEEAYKNQTFNDINRITGSGVGNISKRMWELRGKK